MADWDTVTILRKRPPKPSSMKTEQAINAARRQGAVIQTTQKYGAATNKQHVATKNIAKLERETEELRHETIDADLAKLIQQARLAKGWSQKELATKINEKPQVINEYEGFRAIPNQVVLGKMEKVLGIKLRGKDRGKPLPSPGTKR